MIKQKFDIDNLRVASPCSVGWETMSGGERARFCRSCSLNVYNVSEMTPAEVRALIEKTDGKACGRIYRRADGTVLTKDCPVGLRAYYRRTARFAGAALTAILGLVSLGFGQKDSKKAKVCKVPSEASVSRLERKTGSNMIVGTITDQNTAVVPGVKIVLINEETGKKLRTTTSDDGYYFFSAVAAGNYEFRFESGGFKKVEIKNLEVKENEKLDISVQLKPSGESVTIGLLINEPAIDMKSSGVSYTIKPNRFPPF